MATFSNSSTCDPTACVAPLGECKTAGAINLTGIDPIVSWCECLPGYTYARADIIDRSRCDLKESTETTLSIVCGALMLILAALNFRSFIRKSKRNRHGRMILAEKTVDGFFGALFFLFHVQEDGIGTKSVICFSIWQSMMVLGGSVMIKLLTSQLKPIARLRHDENALKSLSWIEWICHFAGLCYALPLIVGLFIFVKEKNEGNWDAANRASTTFYIGSLIWASVWSYWFAELARRISDMMSNSNSVQGDDIKSAFLGQVHFLRRSMLFLSFICFLPMLYLLFYEFTIGVWRYRWFFWWFCVIATILSQYVGHIFVDYHSLISKMNSSIMSGSRKRSHMSGSMKRGSAAFQKTVVSSRDSQGSAHGGSMKGATIV